MSRMAARTLAACPLLLFVSTASAQVFAPATSYAIGQRSYIVAAADLDGDGDVDLAASREGQNALVILKNNAHGTFSFDSAYSVGNDPGGIEPADLDNDGDLDLAVTDYYNHTVYILLNDGHGVLSRGSAFASGGMNAHKLCAVDLDKDGDIDLAVPNSGSGNVAIFMNNGDASFAIPVLYQIGTFPYTVISGDVDADGDADLVVTVNGEHKVSILLNNGSGVLGAPTSYPVGRYPQSPALADFNKDGKLDLAVPNAYPGTPTVSVLKGNGDGTFQAKVDWAGSRPHTVTVQDYDMDGNLDMAVANNETNTVGLFLGNGDLTFKLQVSFSVGVGPNTTDAADFDKDGDYDLVAANFDNDGAPGNGLSTLMNTTRTTSVETGVEVAPASYALDQNYPNPFNPTTVIRYQLPVASEVRLSVHDILGYELSILVNERKLAGTYEEMFDATSQPSGVLFYRLSAGSFLWTRKMILVK